MKKSQVLNIPNLLTMARLVLSLSAFTVLALYGYGFWADHHSLVLHLVMAIFVLAVSTDFLDGYLARRWGLVSTFGRIADPFVDKITIVGGFIMLTEISVWVRPWFAVVILIREFLISGLRSFFEAHNIPFGASWSGKIKMIAQSITIPAVLFYEANFVAAADSQLAGIGWLETGCRWIALVCLGLTLLTTVFSSISYLRRAVRELKSAKN